MAFLITDLLASPPSEHFSAQDLIISDHLEKFGLQMFAGHQISVLQVYIHSYGGSRQTHGSARSTSGNLVKIDGHLEICETRDARLMK